MRHHIALVVGGAAPIPAPLLLRQLPRVGVPARLVVSRLHIVVAVQQHRGAAVRGGSETEKREGSVNGLHRVHVGNANFRERLLNPGGACRARAIVGAEDRIEADSCGEVGFDLVALAGDVGAELVCSNQG